MEDRRRQSEKVLHNVENQSDETRLQSRDSLLQSVQQAMGWINQVKADSLSYVGNRRTKMHATNGNKNRRD